MEGTAYQTYAGDMNEGVQYQMKKGKFLSMLCAAALSVSSFVQLPVCENTVVKAASGPVSYYGELKTKGNQIIGSKTGNPAQVKGMSFFWSNWGGNMWNSGTVNRMVDEFKCEILLGCCWIVV